MLIDKGMLIDMLIKYVDEKMLKSSKKLQTHQVNFDLLESSRLLLYILPKICIFPKTHVVNH